MVFFIRSLQILAKSFRSAHLPWTPISHALPLWAWPSASQLGRLGRKTPPWTGLVLLLQGVLLRSQKCSASSQKGRQHGRERGHLLTLRLGLRPRTGSHRQVLQALTLTKTWHGDMLEDGLRGRHWASAGGECRAEEASSRKLLPSTASQQANGEFWRQGPWTHVVALTS